MSTSVPESPQPLTYLLPGIQCPTCEQAHRTVGHVALDAPDSLHCECPVCGTEWNEPFPL